MTLRNFDWSDDNHFIAMEYYGLILNRTFLILLFEDSLVGVQVNGAIAAEAVGSDFLADIITTNIVLASRIVRGDLNNRYAYIKREYVLQAGDLEFGSDAFLKLNANFAIHKSEIKNVWHDPKKKWGMGPYPHDGKVYLETTGNKKREFIILGSQSGADICQWILML